MFYAIKLNLQTPPILFHLFTVLISLASCLVEMTVLVKMILLTTLLLENGFGHLLNYSSMIMEHLSFF